MQNNGRIPITYPHYITSLRHYAHYAITSPLHEIMQNNGRIPITHYIHYIRLKYDR